MKIDAQAGLLCGINYLPSPHHDDRPPATVIDLLVIHGISMPPNQFGGNAIIDLFCDRLDINEHDYYKTINTKVSAHVLIRRSGELLQFVPFHKRAWHAGVSSFAGRERCNDFAIGVELEGTDDIPYEDIQYQQLAKLTKAIMVAYPDINKDRIVGHCDIAPGRKTDPGSSFNWHYYKKLLIENS